MIIYSRLEPRQTANSALEIHLTDFTENHFLVVCGSSRNPLHLTVSLHRYYIEATCGVANTHINTPSAPSATSL